MGASAPVPVPLWTTEDDLLLKNAVEHGASLESLAKGAVQFSRRFTMQELQNRWHALLYDAVESAEASARMITCSASSPSKPNRFEDSKENKSVSGKRKTKSVHSCYYSMRKNQMFDLRYLDFLLGPGDGNCIGDGDEPSPANCMFGGLISNHSGLQDSSFDVTHHTLSQSGTGSIATSNVGVTANAFYTGFQNPIEEELHIAHNNMHKQIPLTFGAGIPFSMSCSGVEELGQPKEVPVSSVLEAHDLQEKTTAISDQSKGNRANVCSEFGDIRVFNSPISDCCTSIHNLGVQKPTWSTIVSTPALPYVHLNENEQHMGKAFVVPEDGGMNNTNTSGSNVSSLDSKQGDQIPPDEMCKESDEKGQYNDGGGHAVFSSGSQILPFVSALHPQFPELHEGVSCCTLNTDDTEIPSDDDVCVPNQMLPSSFLSVTELQFREAGNPTLKDEAGDVELAKLLNYNANFYLGMPACNFNCNNGENVSGSKLEVDDSELAVKHSPVDHEEIPSGSENDIPQFSDVEQMILDMDLSPDDQDLYSGRKVSRYQHVDSKKSIFSRYQHVDSKKSIFSRYQHVDSKKSIFSRYQHVDSKESIIRLEQAAHSFMQKALASRGAFAVLYGRRSNFYIKKPEVLLGRATEGFDVDIDLGREGRANKISRRQAIIKVDESGSFCLKNLGKCPIFVNNRKVAPTDSVILTSSCLIEVRGMPFMFETKSKFFEVKCS